jgi:hypothetical protein
MKRDDLKALELSDEAIDKIMAMHGADIEKHKSDLATLQTSAKALETQLTEANTTIEGFKKLDVDSIKAAADEWKTKAEKATSDAAAQVLKIKQDHALEKQLRDTFRVKDFVAVKAHLQADALKFDEKSETFAGLSEQIDPLKKEYGAYFSDYTEPPRIVSGGNNHNILGDKGVNAAREAAGLPVAK